MTEPGRRKTQRMTLGVRLAAAVAVSLLVAGCGTRLDDAQIEAAAGVGGANGATAAASDVAIGTFDSGAATTDAADQRKARRVTVTISPLSSTRSPATRRSRHAARWMAADPHISKCGEATRLCFGGAAALWGESLRRGHHRRSMSNRGLGPLAQNLGAQSGTPASGVLAGVLLCLVVSGTASPTLIGDANNQRYRPATALTSARR